MGMLLNVLRKLKKLEDPLVRDFTPSAEADMKEVAQEKYDEDDLFTKYITDPFGRWLDKKGYLEVLVGADTYRKSVIDCYNYSARNIEKICQQARDYDSRYGQIIATCDRQSERVCTLTKALAECIDINSSRYSPEQAISDRLMWFRTKWAEDERIGDIEDDARNDYNQLNGGTVTEEDVKFYCGRDHAETTFEDYNEFIYKNALDWDALDIVFLSAGTVIYKGVEMTIDELLSVLTEEGYSEKIVREQLDKIISSVISANKTAQTVMKDYETAKSIVESLIKDYLEDKDNNSTLKNFVNAMGGIEAVKQLAETAPQMLDYLFTDYEKGLKILDDIDQTSGCSEMNAAVDKLRKSYNDKWAGLCQKVQDMSQGTLEEITKDGVKEWIKKEYGDYSILSSVLEIAEVKENVDGTHKLIALRKVTDNLQNAFEDAIEKIRSGSYTEEDLSRVENLFDMLKESTKSTYETYRDMCKDDPSKQIWINEQISKLERMTISNSTPFLFEEY